MLIRRLLPLLLLATWLPGQDDRLTEKEQEMEKRIRMRAERAESPEEREKLETLQKERRDKEGSDGDGMSEEEALKRLTPEERLARTVRTNASAFCRFVAAIKPPKLMPGQSGVMVVSALLNGQAVLPSPPPMEMTGARQQGFVTLGEIGFHPAGLASQAAGYAGRPVYDNYAIFEIPVTVAADASVGTKQPVVVDLRFDIYDGVTAQPIGRFFDRATAEVEVGRMLDPMVQGGRPAAAAPADVDPSTASAGGTTAANPGTPTETAGKVIRGQEPTLASEPDGVPSATTPQPAAPIGDWAPIPDDGGMLPLPVWLGGGALLVVIVLMLARRK